MRKSTIRWYCVIRAEYGEDGDIVVKFKLPKDFKPVLFRTDAGVVSYGWYVDAEDTFWYDHGYGGVKLDDVLEWAYIPQGGDK